jgi:hypothetical protein
MVKLVEVDEIPTEGKNFKLVEVDAIPSSSGTSIMQDIGQGLGNIAAGGVRGAGSIGATLLWPIDKATDLIKGDRSPNITGLVTGKQPLSRNQERRMQMDQGLQEMGADPNSWMYKGGKIGAEIAGTMGVGGALGNVAARVAPSMPIVSNALASGGFNLGDAAVKGAGFLPWLQNMGARVAGGAATGAVSAGMIDPNNAASGALIGGALPPGIQAAGKLGSAIGSGIKNTFAVAPQNRELAEKAINQYGIPLGVSDITSSPVIKAARSVLNDAPLTGGIGARQRDAVQEGFNKAVGGTFGAPEAKLTSEVVDAAKKRMGAEFDRLWNGNALQVDATLVQKMMDLEKQAMKLPQGDAQSLSAELRDIYSKMKPDANGGLIVEGDVANKFQQYLRKRADTSQGLKNELSDLRQSLISAFNRSISPADAAALTLNRGQYKAFKTVEPLLNSAEAGVAGRLPGDIPAALLPNAATKSYGNVAGTPFEDLSQIGSQFIADRVARTGGSVRAALQNSAIGSVLGLGAFHNPIAAGAVIPAAMGVNKMLGSPAIARSMVSPAVQSPAQYNELLQFLARQQPVMMNQARGGLLAPYATQD